jgi:hypothetical protein
MNQQVRKVGSCSTASALESVIRATEDLADYAEAQRLTEADELLIELLAAIFASRQRHLPETSTASKPRANDEMPG